MVDDVAHRKYALKLYARMYTNKRAAAFLASQPPPKVVLPVLLSDSFGDLMNRIETEFDGEARTVIYDADSDQLQIIDFSFKNVLEDIKSRHGANAMQAHPNLTVGMFLAAADNGAGFTTQASELMNA